MIKQWLRRWLKRPDTTQSDTSSTYHPQPADMDLIRMVQTARMAHDDEAIPSQMTAVYWIEAKRQATIDAPAPTPRAGEFRIATDVHHVDALWQAIQQATQQGALGYKSKVSTQPAFEQRAPDARAICVRTYDAEDQADRERVEDRLRAILDAHQPIVDDAQLPYERIGGATP